MFVERNPSTKGAKVAAFQDWSGEGFCSDHFTIMRILAAHFLGEQKQN